MINIAKISYWFVYLKTRIEYFPRDFRIRCMGWTFEKKPVRTLIRRVKHKVVLWLIDMLVGDAKFIRNITFHIPKNYSKPLFNNLKNCDIRNIVIFYRKIKYPMATNCNRCTFDFNNGFDKYNKKGNVNENFYK